MTSNSYKVTKIEDHQLTVSGKANHYLWNTANTLTNFFSPWEGCYQIETILFKALWDNNYLYFYFKVWQNAVCIDTTKKGKESINNSDRVELFFRQNSNLNPYYCLEIDPTPRIMDFKAKPNKNFDFNWNWPPTDIEVKSSIEKEFYIVEGAISIQSLKNLNLLKNGKIETGIYNATYLKDKEGRMQPKWVTWIDPNTEHPNFHTANSFGEIVFLH